jgi:hypothetical protein
MERAIAFVLNRMPYDEKLMSLADYRKLASSPAAPVPANFAWVDPA